MTTTTPRCPLSMHMLALAATIPADGALLCRAVPGRLILRNFHAVDRHPWGQPGWATAVRSLGLG